MKYYPFLLAGLLGLAACSDTSTEEKLVGLWQETEVINPQMDQSIADQKIFRDTIGSSTTPAQNLQLYGIADADSMKAQLSRDIDNALLMRAEAVRTTRYEFLKGGKMVIHTTGAADTAAWEVEEDGALLLDEGKHKGEPGMQIRFEIMSLNDTALRLHYSENYLSSTTVFRRVKK